MDENRLARAALLGLLALVGVTAVAGGAALMLGAVGPRVAGVLSPPLEYLEGSPFSSYLLPGAVLALVLGGMQLLAFAMLLARHRWSLLAVAAFDALIWIFVQMMVIPFSVLQAVYFAAGLAEVGFLLLLLGLTRPAGAATITQRAPEELTYRGPIAL